MPDMCRTAFTMASLGVLGFAVLIMYGLALRWVDWELLPPSVRRRVLWWRRQKMRVAVLCTVATVTGIATCLQEGPHFRAAAPPGVGPLGGSNLAISAHLDEAKAQEAERLI